MITKRSSKFNDDKELWHDGRPVHVDRIFGGIGFPRFAVVLGEERFFGETHYFVLAETETERNESMADLIDSCRKLQAEYSVLRWFGRVDVNVKEILAICNRQLYSTGYRGVVVSDVPRIGEYIDQQMSTVHMLVRPSQKRLHFFNESMIQSELFSLPTRDIKADEHHRATALANVVASMLRYSGDDHQASQAEPLPENWY